MNIFKSFPKSNDMRTYILIVHLMLPLFLFAQSRSEIESYLVKKYPYSDTISSLKPQYLKNSLVPLNDSTLSKYQSNVDLYQASLRELICWMPDEYKIVVVSDNNKGAFFIINPLDMRSTMHEAISYFDGKYIAQEDIENYCYAVANMLHAIGMSANTRLGKLEKIEDNQYQIPYLIKNGEREKVYRNIIFTFDKLYLVQIRIVNPTLGSNKIEYANQL